MNTDTLDIVMPFLKDMIIRETNVNNVISAVNKNFHREFKDVKIIISLFRWSNDEISSDFFYQETISESTMRNVRIYDNIIYFNLMTGNSTYGREKHKVSISVENGSVMMSVSTHHFIDDSHDLLPEDEEDKFYVRTFCNIRSLGQLKQTFKHIWLDNAYFIKNLGYNLQSILDGDGVIGLKYVCFNE